MNNRDMRLGEDSKPRRTDGSDPVVHAISDSIESLALAYIEAGVLPAAREADALHVAAATCLELDYQVSWNHRHMTRPMKGYNMNR